MSKTVVVTGGAGYIGSHMAKMLREDGYRVVVFDNLGRGNRDAVLGAELVTGDLTEQGSLEKLFGDNDIEAVLHFAAFAYVGESVSDPDIYYRNNVLGTLNLLDAMRKHEISRLVFSSTCATYGVPQQLPITEDTPQAPINPYGQSKLMVEQILKDYAVAYDFRSIALRYFNAAGSAADGTLGERHDPETHLLPLVMFEAMRMQQGGNPDDTALMVFGDDFDTPDGTCVRDYIHVNDLCRAHVHALDRLVAKPELGAEQFNLGVNRGVSVLEVIKCCEQVTGVTIPYKMAPRRAGDPPELVSDASRAMRELGWQPQYPDIKDSIEHAWNWFNSNRKLIAA